MITQEKIDVYRYYNGDSDSWARSGTKKQKQIVNDADWYLIDSLIQDFMLEKAGISSKEYIVKFHEKLKESCDKQLTIDELKKLSEAKKAS